MTITIARLRGERRTVVVISGAVTAWAVPSLRRALAKALRIGAPILVDVTQATSIHRAGVAALVAAYQQAERAGTSMLLRAEPGQIRTVLAAFGIPPEDPH
jgi:anti-anti-sigma regulatory factor